jgi:hypothetical protein
MLECCHYDQKVKHVSDGQSWAVSSQPVDSLAYPPLHVSHSESPYGRTERCHDNNTQVRQGVQDGIKDSQKKRGSKREKKDAETTTAVF